MLGRRLAAGGATLACVAALGVPLGLLWWAIAPRPKVTAIGDGTTAPFPVSETTFAVEGYFTLVMIGAGMVCGYGAYLVQYRLARSPDGSARRGGRLSGIDLRLPCLLGLTAGALLGSVVAWRVGVQLDAGPFERALANAAPGDVIRSGLHLDALSALLAWPFVSVLQYGLFDAVSMLRHDTPVQRYDPVEEHPPAEGAAPAPTGPDVTSGPDAPADADESGAHGRTDATTVTPEEGPSGDDRTAASRDTHARPPGAPGTGPTS